MNRIDTTFARLKANGEKALIAYIMAGDPSLTDTEALVLELERAGADIIELGVPFSDPIADGPVIQKAAERALCSGTSLRKILDTVTNLRRRTQIPLVLMAYYNSIHACGEGVFCRDAAGAGVDGLIVPDMPPEEDTLLAAAACEGGPHLIYLLAPTSTSDRFAQVARRSKGFVYYVSLTGITGAQLPDLEGVRRNITKIRRLTKVSVAIGFGVATPDDAARVGEIADGVIVGTAIVRRIEEYREDPRMVEKVGQYIASLKAAVAGASTLGAGKG
ncbi:MAG TPA: tryptophan synthase subunit alpha [Nitrospiraceae bacterium]|nr:tryptophan synthase subunit alpha [Nitrospiraceae bacterium]